MSALLNLQTMPFVPGMNNPVTYVYASFCSRKHQLSEQTKNTKPPTAKVSVLFSYYGILILV